jgi:hypothetical protein
MFILGLDPLKSYSYGSQLFLRFFCGFYNMLLITNHLLLAFSIKFGGLFVGLELRPYGIGDTYIALFFDDFRRRFLASLCRLLL